MTVGLVDVIIKEPLPSLEISLSILTPPRVMMPSMLSMGNRFSSSTCFDDLEQATNIKRNARRTETYRCLMVMLQTSFPVSVDVGQGQYSLLVEKP
jgi:hypothetical protein